jgi:hypothetical protein
MVGGRWAHKVEGSSWFVVKCSREQVRGSSASEAANRQPQRGGRAVKKVNADLYLLLLDDFPRRRRRK